MALNSFSDDRKNETEESTLATLPPSVPLQWHQIPPERWPYSGPEDEYLRSPYEYTPEQLAWRWQGVAAPEDIKLLYAIPELRQQRDMAQWFRIKSDQTPDFTDPEYAAKATNLCIAWLTAQRDRIQQELDTNQRKETVWLQKPDGSGTYIDRFVELSTRDASRLRNDHVRVTKELLLLQGKATEIVQSTVNINVTTEEERAALKRIEAARQQFHDKELSIQVINRKPAALPEGDAIEGEVVAANETVEAAA